MTIGGLQGNFQNSQSSLAHWKSSNQNLLKIFSDITLRKIWTTQQKRCLEEENSICMHVVKDFNLISKI